MYLVVYVRGALNLCIAVMTDKLRPDELEAFKAAFDMFDKNQDGTISTKVRKGLLGVVVTVRDCLVYLISLSHMVLVTRFT